ncbi:DnaT-like ssDNA-binding protein [Leptothrix discophora]|uniref:Putative DnaT-like domain-containing protein n=1 Tax=Leptothrix discophora TaxID=89 RepID=A0ABT9G0C1_LEPDI|nr:DnaT-like ssDNA-binding protein [Leptothrix discophora]MDP4299924.1 hypothetical protein [Leptothrix discophora]
MTTLIVEDGSKPAGANTYVGLTEADQYHVNYANVDWAGYDTESRNQALVQATRAVDLLYGARYQSAIYPSTTQELLFPRMWFEDLNGRIVTDTTIPKCLKNAVCELALMQISGTDILPQKSTVKNVKSKSVKAGEVATSVEYFKATDGETYSGFNKIDITLRPILKAAETGSWRLTA